MRKCTDRHTIPSSNAWVPATEGLIAGGEVVKDLINAAGTMRITPEKEAESIPAQKAKAAALKMREESRRLKLAAMSQTK